VRFVAFDISVHELVQSENLTGVVFADEQIGFLAGYLGGLMSGQRPSSRVVVSAVCGLPVSGVERFIDGYEAGARHAVPNARVLVDFSQSWVDHDRCEALANDQIDRGSRVVAALAGPSSSAVLQAAELRGVWGVGVDEDGSYVGTRILASAVKHFDRALFSTVKAYVDGELPPGDDLRFDLRLNGVGLVGLNRGVPEEIRRRLAKVAPLVRSGALASLMPKANAE